MRYILLISALVALTAGTTIYAASEARGASARNADSIYAGAFGGVTILPDIDVTQLGVTDDLETDAGFVVGGVVGYKWAVGLRAEGEISYRQNDNDTLSGLPVTGDVSAFTFMANAWYDIDTGTPLIPYLGGGIGAARVATETEFLGVKVADDSDVVFAWQVGGGVGYEVVTGVVVGVDYRYLATTDPEMTDEAGVDFDAEYASHNIMLGIRGHF